MWSSKTWYVVCRTPQGVRGLKLQRSRQILAMRGSHSARSAWIETELGDIIITPYSVALRKECVD